MHHRLPALVYRSDIGSRRQQRLHEGDLIPNNRAEERLVGQIRVSLRLQGQAEERGVGIRFLQLQHVLVESSRLPRDTRCRTQSSRTLLSKPGNRKHRLTISGSRLRQAQCSAVCPRLSGEATAARGNSASISAYRRSPSITARTNAVRPWMSLPAELMSTAHQSVLNCVSVDATAEEAQPFGGVVEREVHRRRVRSLG